MRRLTRHKLTLVKLLGGKVAALTEEQIKALRQRLEDALGHPQLHRRDG